MLWSTVKPFERSFMDSAQKFRLEENANVVSMLVNKYVDRVFHFISPSHYCYCVFNVFKESTKVPKHEVLDEEMKICTRL